MKASKAQIKYINDLNYNMYTDDLLNQLTVSTASKLIKVWRIYRFGNPVIPQMYDWIQQAEKEVFGKVIYQ